MNSSNAQRRNKDRSGTPARSIGALRKKKLRAAGRKSVRKSVRAGGSSESRLEHARLAVAALSNWQLDDLLSDELDRRRLDIHGNPARVPDLYMAAMLAISSILDSYSHSEIEERCLVYPGTIDRLEAVTRGARLLEKDQEIVVAIREIGIWVTQVVRTSKRNPEHKYGKGLARTLEKRFGRPVDAERVARALQLKHPRRVTEVVAAAGVIPFPEGDKDAWRGPHRRVTDALKR